MKMGNNRSNAGHSPLDKVAMFTLAAFPILSYYKSFGPLLYSSIIAFVLLFFGISNRKIIIGKMYNTPFMLYWIYVAIMYLFSMNSFTLSYLFPGGISFFIFAIMVGVYGSFFDYELLRKYSNYIFVFASVLFIIQNLVFFFIHERLCFLLPLGTELNYGDLTYAQLYRVQVNSLDDRFSSIFAEPSYFAQYGILTLILDLFNEKNKTKLFTPLSLFFVLMIVISRSGVGFISLAFVCALKIINYATTNRSFKHLFILVLLIPIGLYAVQRYMATDAGEKMIARADEINSNAPSSGFARVMESSLVFASLNVETKLFGTDTDFVSELKEHDVFINGIFNVLIDEGIIGMLLLIIFYLSGMIKKPIAYTALGSTFFLISAMEWTYMGPLMVITSAAIISISKKQSKGIKAT